ncbi:hypothetical protein PIB30_005168 [Stylosanthes scabra]|uniref:F-box domain-containing protein n=1 Tax=Stylosanthes scabra TaxID=79078 RepID=A0ABU6R2S0_9FABA|nr:hypothetical protein [Stylosanthes scabra]
MKAHGYGDVERCNVVCPTLPVLPDEIVIEILVRLPVKSLLQFKRVCKSWRILISSSQFAIHNFRQRCSADRHLPSRLVYANKSYNHCGFGFLPLQPLFKNPSATTPVVSFDMGYCIGGIVIRGSCNGLLCLHHLGSRCFCLWNPCTGAASQWIHIKFVTSLTYFGFGYDHVHDKYKLVTAHRQDLIRIYTFGANSCTLGPNFDHPAVGLSGNIGKYLSGTGTLNWMAKVKEKNWVILSFDLPNETFGQVSLPYLSGHNTCDPELQILRNCLSFTIDHKDTVLDVWMMKDYGVWESWTMISRVNLWCPYHNYPLTPLSIWGHDVLLLMLPDRRLVLYNSDTGLFHYPLIDSSSDSILSPIYVCYKRNSLRTFFVYHDSLVSPP